MLGIGYFKSEPTEFVRMNVNGKIKKEGPGISGLYLPFRTGFELVSLTAMDQGINFTEVSTDNQEISLNGGFVYKVKEPELVLGRYNFSIDPENKQYKTEDFMNLPQHILQLVRAETRKIVQSTNIERLLVMSDELSETVSEGLKNSDNLVKYGISLEMLYFSTINPKPEISRALEANFRESLLKNADVAIYDRRAKAVEQERAIQENEMKTLIDIEKKKEELVALEGKNTLAKAEYKAQAIEKEMKAFGSVDPALLTANALYQMGINADKIENISITPELIGDLLKRKG